MLIAVGVVFAGRMRGTAAPSGELAASFTTVLGNSDYFDDEAGQALTLAGRGGGADDPLVETPQSSASTASIVADESPVDISGALPSRDKASGLGPRAWGAGGPGRGDRGHGTGAGNFTQGGKGPARVSGGTGKTMVYGVQGEGRSFVYVFDHSASMGAGDKSPLASAKRELLASLAELGEAQQFQIIFYNEKPTRMNVGRSYGGLVLADEQTKRQAERFVSGIVADGGTRHEAALEMALKLGPNVIFFLTDADEPQLSPAQLARIKRMNGERSVINAIEFGDGRGGSRDNFLKQVAHQNGGQYVYIDISRRSVRK